MWEKCRARLKFRGNSSTVVYIMFQKRQRISQRRYNSLTVEPRISIRPYPRSARNPKRPLPTTTQTNQPQSSGKMKNINSRQTHGSTLSPGLKYSPDYQVWIRFSCLPMTEYCVLGRWTLRRMEGVYTVGKWCAWWFSRVYMGV